jgi:hypothetical protein
VGVTQAKDHTPIFPSKSPRGRATAQEHHLHSTVLAHNMPLWRFLIVSQIGMGRLFREVKLQKPLLVNVDTVKLVPEFICCWVYFPNSKQ